LPIYDGGGGTGFLADRFAAFYIKLMMNEIESAIPTPRRNNRQRRARRQVFRDGPPLTVGGENVHEAVHDLAHDYCVFAATAPAWWDQRFDQLPFVVGDSEDKEMERPITSLWGSGLAAGSSRGSSLLDVSDRPQTTGDCRTEAVAAARCSHELVGLADERNSEIGLALSEEPRVAEKDAGDEIQIVFAMALSVNNRCREIAPVQIQAADKKPSPKGFAKWAVR
jgi:hypothetical protein